MDPYKVLGVSLGATKDEIRRAYLDLVKKYHPDKYAAGPMRDLANEKLKEVNLAYETLQKGFDNGPTGQRSDSWGYRDGQWSYGGGYGQGASSRAYTGPYANELQRARAALDSGNVQGARYILNSVPLRNGEWYYLSGIAHFRSGNYEEARAHLKNAADADPDNAEYVNAYRTVLHNANPYGSGRTMGGDWDAQCCNLCAGLVCTNCLCNCCCGR